MFDYNVWNKWLTVFIIGQISATSFNQPKFCPSATWNATGITFADSTLVGSSAYGIFININNTIYVASQQFSRILVWFEGNSIPTSMNVTASSYPFNLFVTITNDIYIDSGGNNVRKWNLNSVNNTFTLSTGGGCFGLFISRNNSLYCSLYRFHKVIKRSLNSSDNQITIVAGTGCSGFLPDMLFNLQGIFVDINFNIYVADSSNNRIQLFPSGQLVAITVAGYGASGTITLGYPTGVVLDADGYLFIVDRYNHRIVGSGPTGFRCVVGCSGTRGSRSDQLFYPQTMAFDSYGNIFVTDSDNHRVQKFLLATNSCDATIVPQQPLTTPSSAEQTTTNNPPISHQQTISYNRPKFCALTSWKSNALTFANQSMIGVNPSGLHVNTNNTVYAASSSSSFVTVWLEGSVKSTRTIKSSISSPQSIFVTSSDDIYIANGYSYGQVDKWLINSTSSIPVMYIPQSCSGLFVDINNTLYCSLSNLHQVVSKSLDGLSNTVKIVAGTGCSGSSSSMLASPKGIFVDINFNIYVADYSNSRIQLFPSGQLVAITVAGYGASGTITLSYPIGVVLDADGYLFIVDNNNNRIVGSGPTGFRCVVGCSRIYGSRSDQLAVPQTMAFDSYGNIFVTDYNNHRVQKFLLNPDSCVISYNRPKVCPSASWNATAITFASISMVGSQPVDIFVDVTNAIYVSSSNLNLVRMWSEGSTIPRNLSGNFSTTAGLFVANNGDVYVDNGRVVKWALSTTYSIPVMNFPASCYSLFVDINNTLYCSLNSLHKVLKTFLDNNDTNMSMTVAGTGLLGSTSTMLNSPKGIFVNINFDLYVADCGNNRIQRYHFGQSNATTVAGNGSLGTVDLHCPSDVILDGDDYLFIVDSYNHRVVGSGPDGFRCVTACSSTSGSASNQLNSPRSLAFDNLGNLFVMDTNNSRIQKFLLATTCDKVTASAVQTTAVPVTSTQHPKDLTNSPSSRFTIKANVSVEQSSTMTSAIQTSKFPSNQSCFPPGITLIPSTSSSTSPLQFRRSQDFYISSYLQLDCNASLSAITQWTINNCSTSCSSPLQLNGMIVTTTSELFVPARTLTYGTYQLTLTVSMAAAPYRTSSASAYVRITPSGITANLVQFGTSMITRGYEQDLSLDPGTFSVDPDATNFNASNWNYKYYCRIYPRYQFPNTAGSYLTIDDPMIDRLNPSCLSNRSGNGTALRYGGAPNSIQSSLTILTNSLKPNQTYQFMVIMGNRINATVQATGFVLVQVEDAQPQLIVIGCVIPTLCALNMEYQFVNPTTQVALFSACIGTCTSITNITWTVYSGVMNSTSKIVHWTPFSQMNQYANRWFFGSNTTNFTSTNDLFLSNPSIEYWRFEVVYSFSTETSLSALNFLINQPPQNGSCSINPLNGTTTTPFVISCPDWQDQDGIKDYSFYIRMTDQSGILMIAFGFMPNIEVRLPAGNGNASSVNLFVQIRDTLGCVSEYNLTTVTVVSDSAQINDFIGSLQVSSNAGNTNPIVQALTSGNQNVVGQLITSLSQIFNQMNTQSLQNAVSSGVPATSISVSSLASHSSQSTSTPLNISALIEYNQQLNTQAMTREYLISFTKNLLITTSSSIILQASSLAQLTQATNQLTRTTSLLASSKCYQLSRALYSMAERIAYEDVQTAATQLTQCTNNVITAINGPLQQRTSVLDLDSSRANTVPEDYDTDLESPWSNLNLFVDGTDVSFETIERNRNLFYQKQAASQISDQVAETIALVTAALNIHLNVGQNITKNTSALFIALETTSFQSLSNKLIQPFPNAQIRIPTHFQSNATANTIISLRSMLQPLASAAQSSSQSNTNLSRSISLTILDRNGDELSIRTNLTHPIELIIPRDANLVIPPMTLQNVTAFNSTPHQQLLRLHFVNILTLLPISVHFEIHPLNSSVGYLFIYRFDSAPILNSSVNEIDGWTLLCPSNLTTDNLYTYFIDNQRTAGHQSVIFGLRELNATEITNVCSATSITNPPITNDRYDFTSNYELRIYTSGCYYLDTNNNWQSDGLIVGLATNHYETHCYSTHLTTFAGGFAILPTPINWNYVFANADFMKNKTVYVTVIVVSILYFLVVVYARYKDRKDLNKLGVTPLPDNHPSDQYFYQVLVFTGHRKDAGTKSRVHFILSGDKDDTPVRTFSCPNRSILQRDGVDAFIMAVPKSLGPLNYLRVWHDNTGEGTSASWFLKYIIVQDLQTMSKVHFICQRWLAVEKDDGKIERVLFVAYGMEKQDLSFVLSKQTYHRISEDHLWFSIFSRPISNRFTRVQRCTCSFVLLFLSMFLNILYYDLSTEAKSNNSTASLSLGPLHISAQQVVIGVIVEILSLVPSLLLVQSFQRLRPRRVQISSLRQVLHQLSPLQASATVSGNGEDTMKKKGSKWTLPWWWIFCLYGLCFLLVVLSIFFTISRGIEFGDLKTQKWLASILTGFFSSILLIQPIKVFSLVIFCAFINRNPDDDKEAGEHLQMEEFHFSNTEQQDQPLFIYRPPVRFDRLTEGEVTYARRARLKELHMWSIIRESVFYLTFLTVLCIITYSNRDQTTFLQVDHLRKFLLNTRQVEHDYTKISTIGEYWSWLEGSFVSNLRSQQWYNDDPPRHLNGFINDKSNRLIGWATIRQLRRRSTGCPHQKTNAYCEEQRSFQLGWINETTRTVNSTINQAFRYRADKELDTYSYVGNHGSYGGGGYVYELRGRLSDLRSNLSKLHQLGWIDNRTEALIIQFNLYNPNSQLFTSVTLLAEYLLTGGIETQSLFQPFNFHLAFTSTFQLICSIIYIVFILYLMFIQIQSCFHLKSAYLKQFWTYVQLGIIACSWASVAIYAWRYREAKRIGNLLNETNGYVYINLRSAVYFNEMLTSLLAFCCFFATIQFLRLCRFNPRLSLFTRTLQHAFRELLSFTMMFSIVFMAFVPLFYLLFVSKMWHCSTLLQTAEMLFEMILMKFNASELMAASAFLGPFSFTLFIFIVVFVCMSMFLTIINDSFRRVRENGNDDEEIFTFMWDRFQRWTGLKQPTELEMHEIRDAQMRSQYIDPIENFPNQIDKLLDVICRLYMRQRTGGI